jgi:hypothetical protein
MSFYLKKKKKRIKKMDGGEMGLQMRYNDY